MMQPGRKFVRTEHHPFKTCGRFNCPVCVKSIAKSRIKPRLKAEFFGSSPAPFIGRFGYPSVNVGVLSMPEVDEDAWLYDAPRTWASRLYQIPEIVNFRSALINSHSKSHVRSSSRIRDITQEIGMASRPVELEILLRKKPVIRMSVDSVTLPTGPSAEVRLARITANPKIHAKVDKVFSDTDLKAADAIHYLYRAGFDEGSLSKILSVGAVGLKSGRKIVPTRWSITASDDAIGKGLIDLIKDCPTADGHSFYFGGYLGNYFAVMLFPEVWSYELFETLAGRGVHTTDYESYQGRKSYASQTAGGYYASRLPALEKLRKLKRQASVLAVRVITSEYTVPLGVFVVRESVRKALQSSPVNFSSRELMTEYASAFVRKRFGHDLTPVLRNSRVLSSLKQRKLTNY